MFISPFVVSKIKFELLYHYHTKKSIFLQTVKEENILSPVEICTPP